MITEYLSPKTMNIAAVVPAYNEEKKIADVLNKISKLVDKVIVVDDGSIDKTYEVVENIKNKKKIVLLKHIVNLGQGAALQTGFDFLKNKKVDIVITFDADGQHRVADISRIIQPIVLGKADVVLGSRFLGESRNIPFGRLIVLKLGIVFTRIYTGLHLTDTHNGFRAFSAQALKKINIRHNRWAHPSDILYQIAKNKLKVNEVPVSIYYTKYSKGKRELVRQTNLDALRIPFKLIVRALLGI